MFFRRDGPVGGHRAPSEAKDVTSELDPEGSPRERPERKKVSSVLFVRSAIMAMLAIFLAAVALVAFFLAKDSLTSQVDRLGSLVRSGILNRTVERLNVQLDEGGRCVTTLETVLVSVWTQQNVSTQLQKLQADASAWFSLGGCGAISGTGWIRPDGTYSFYQALLDDSNVEATTSNITQYTSVNASIPVSGEFTSYRQLLNATTQAPLSAAVQTSPPIDMRDYPWYIQARDSTDRMAYVVFVNPNGRPALIQSRRVLDRFGNFLGEAFVMQYLSDLSTYLAAIPLGGGYLYVTNKSIMLADSFGIPILLQQDNSTLNSLAPSQSKVAPVRDAANFLTAKLGTSPGNVSAAFKDVHLGGGTYSLDVLTFTYKTLTLRAVVIIPRSLIMGSIDRKTRIAIAIIVGVTVGITLIGFGLVCLFTGRVSREFQLRLALVQQLNARKQAEARSETKSRFLANMSHELRTPMAGIIGLLDILLADELTVEQELNLIQIKQCATSLLGLLNDVLDLEKIEAGKMTLASEEFDLGAELESLVDLFAVQCLGKGIEIGLDLPDSVECTVRGDSARVRQIFSNLISNSIKFTKTGHLVVRCWEEPVDAPVEEPVQSKGSATTTPQHSGSFRRDSAGEPRRVRLFFEVEDTGTGIPFDKRESVFESFVQADPSSTRLYGGSGLGLGITRSLVQMMGGKIAILDKNGPGTLIRFDLVFEAPRKSNSSCTSFRLSPEHALLTIDLPTAGSAGETACDDGKGGDGFFGGRGKRKQRLQSPGDEAWLERGFGSDPTSPRAVEAGLAFNPSSPGDSERGRSRLRSFDAQLGLLSRSAGGAQKSGGVMPPHPLVRTLSAIEPLRPTAGGALKVPDVRTDERQLAPIVSGLEGISGGAAVAEAVSIVRRSVVLGIPGALGRGLAKAWLEKNGYATVECEDWSAAFAFLKRTVFSEPLEVPSAGALQQGMSNPLEGPERPDELLVILDIDLLKNAENSPPGQSPSAKLTGLKELLYFNQRARVDWAANQAEANEERRKSEPVKIAVGWLIETTTPSAMRHFLSRTGFPIKVGKPLYPTRLQKLVKMLNDALAEPPTLNVTSPGEYPAAFPPLDVRSPPVGDGRTPSTDFFRMGGSIQGRTLPLEVQADLAKHQIDGALSWSFFDNRGARAPIPAKPSNPESEPQSWSTSPSGTMTSSGAKDASSSVAESPSGGLEPGGFAPPERTISLSIDIPEFSPPFTPHRKESETSPDSNFAFYLEGEPSPLSATEAFPAAPSDDSNPSSAVGSGPLNQFSVLGSLNKSSSFASSSSYDTLLRSQSSGVSSQSSADEYPRGFRGLTRGAMSDKLSPTDRLPGPTVRESISELEDPKFARSSSPSPEISPVTPIVTSAFSSPSLVTALRQSGSSSSLAPAKESPGGESAKSFDGSGGSPQLGETGGAPKLLEMRTSSGPLGGAVEQKANPVHRRSASAQNPDPGAKSSPEQATPKATARKSPPILPLSAKALQGLHILVAEDTPVLQRLAVTLLTKLGAEVVAVDNGRLAVEAVARSMPRGSERLKTLGLVALGRQDENPGSEIPPRIVGVGSDWSGESERSLPEASGTEIEETGGKARAFDCLLMDCQMPQMDGYDATKAIRRLETGTGRHLPILALTAHAMVEDEQKCLAAGMDSYLTKPINTKLLVSTIKKVIGVGRVERLPR